MDSFHLFGNVDSHAIVLMPPFPFDATIYCKVVPLLTEYPVITVDPPGYREPAPRQATMEAYADQVADQLAKLGVTKIIAAGCSMGGYNALALLERYPDLVSGIGMLGSRATADSKEAQAGREVSALAALDGSDMPQRALNAARFSSETSREADPKLEDFLVKMVSAAPKEAVAWCLRAMASRPDRLPVLQKTSIPGIVLHGTDDPSRTMEDAQVMADALGVDPVILAGCGHLVPIEQPEITADQLKQLYAKVFG